MDPLTPVYLLHGRITLLPHESVDENEVTEPNFGDGRQDS